MDALPQLEQLVTSIEATAPTDLGRVRAAVSVAEEMGSRGDALVTHFVQAARAAGCSWSQIGAELGVSKQAAQQAFVAPPRRRRFGRRPGAASVSAKPFERYGEAARSVVTRAQQEAAAVGHGYLGTEHLLLALLAEGDDVAAAALAELGVDLQGARRRVEEIIGRGAGPGAELPMTPRTKKVLELATREAAHLHAELVEPAHLLLALVREGEGVAAKVLVDLGADLPRVRQAVLERLSGGAGPRTPGGPRTG